MPFVPGFEHDVFISYAHVDNLPLRAGEAGWVDQFHRELQVALAARLGRTEVFSIWRDVKLGAADAFDDAIARRLRGSAIFVAVLSPSYCASSYCLSELAEFDRLAPTPSPGSLLGDKRRIVKIGLRPVDREPASLRPITGRRFYRVNSTSDAEEPLRRTLEADPDQQYWMALRDTAAAIEQTLKALKREAERDAERVVRTRAAGSSGDAITAVVNPPSGPRRVAQPARPAVYLAEVADDLDETREDVRRVLEQHEVLVLPDTPLPREALALRTRVEAELPRTTLSVHLIGSLYGKVPPGDMRSIPHAQYDYAGLQARRLPEGCTRIVWLPRALDVAMLRSAAHRMWVESIELQPHGHGAVEVLRIGVEELKETLLRRLLPPPPVVAQPRAPSNLVYISHRPEDESEATLLRDLLRRANQDVILPPKSGDPATLDQHHVINLQNCDALMILYARASALWVREQAVRARKLAPQVLMSICSGPPPDKEDLNLAFGNLVVIDGRRGVSQATVDDLLERLAAERVPA